MKKLKCSCQKDVLRLYFLSNRRELKHAYGFLMTRKERILNTKILRLTRKILLHSDEKWRRQRLISLLIKYENTWKALIN